jgi:hypothetical protein
MALSSETKKATERRETPRRKKQLKVHVCAAEAEAEPNTGWIVDRSIGGLSLSYGAEQAVGAVLRVRPAASPKTPWVQIEVTSCRPEENAWLLGCRFLRNPSYSVLLQFG